MGTYYLQKVANLKNVKDTRYKARFDHYVTRTTQDMAEHLANHHNSTEGEIIAAVAKIAEYLTEQLREGNKVHLNGIGVFEPSLAIKDFHEVKPENAEPYVRVEGLHIDKVVFRPDNKLMTRVNHDFTATRSKRTETVIPQERINTLEQRIDILKQHLTENETITRKKYVELTLLPSTAANNELHQLCSGSNPLLVMEGSGSHIRYRLK